MPQRRPSTHHPDFRHVMAARVSPVAVLSSLLLLSMAPSTGEGRSRRGGATGGEDATSSNNAAATRQYAAATRHFDAASSQSHFETLTGTGGEDVTSSNIAAATRKFDAAFRQYAAAAAVASRRPRTKTGGATCYSCLYRGFLFPKETCKTIECDADMTCYKITGFVTPGASAPGASAPGASAPGSPTPWVVHGCLQPSVIELIRKDKAECAVLRNLAEQLDPDGGPPHGTTFNRCAIHTCENYDVDLSRNICNDGRLGQLWCWQYAIEHDEDTIKASSKDFFNDQEYFRATQLWLQNRRNATKCSEPGLDSCLRISGWFRGRQWSVQTCADTTAVVEMLDKDESCAFLQDTLSNGKMGKNVIKFSHNSSPDDVATSPPSSATCAVQTCDTNGCNAQVPFFHLRPRPPSSTSDPSRPPSTTLSPSDFSTTDGRTDFPTSAATFVTRLSSSLVEMTSTVSPSSSSAASHNLRAPFLFLLLLPLLFTRFSHFFIRGNS